LPDVLITPDELVLIWPDVLVLIWPDVLVLIWPDALTLLDEQAHWTHAMPDTPPDHCPPPDALASATVPPSMHGQRLDAALVLLLPHTGVRHRRRLFETHTVLVNGKPGSKGKTVRAGDVLLLAPRKEQVRCAPSSAFTGGRGEEGGGDGRDVLMADSVQQKVRIVREHAGYAAVFKPGGMHSARIAGSASDVHTGFHSSPSLEDLLPQLFPGRGAEDAPLLVNRLDYLTSGMVIVAFGNERLETFRRMENEGLVEKLYLAVVHGTVSAPLHLAQGLDMARRRQTRVLEQESDDPLRHTGVLPVRSVTPLSQVQPEAVLPQDGGMNMPADCTLVLASIRKGARHQIRAHLAHAGFPIVGDPLYGIAAPHGGHSLRTGGHSLRTGGHSLRTGEHSLRTGEQSFRPDEQSVRTDEQSVRTGDTEGEKDRHPAPILYLHHHHIEFGEFCATCPPPWEEWAEWEPSGR